MSFDISFEGGPDNDHVVARGRIQLGTEVEWFESPLSLWSRGDYECHWQRAALQLIGGEAASFVVSIDDLTDSGERWVAWPQGGHVLFQNWVTVPTLPAESAYDHNQPEAAPSFPPPPNPGAAEPSTWAVPQADLVEWTKGRP